MRNSALPQHLLGERYERTTNEGVLGLRPQLVSSLVNVLSP